MVDQSKKRVSFLIGTFIAVAVLLVLAVTLLPGILNNANQEKMMDAAQDAYAQLDTQGAETPELGIYEAQGNYIGIKNGKSTKVFASRSEAMTALLGEEASNYYCKATTTEGLCAVLEGAAQQLVEDFDAAEGIDAASLTDCSTSAMPAVYSNLCIFEECYITGIQVFVGQIDNPEREYTLEISVVYGGSVKKASVAIIKNSYTVNVPGRNLTENAWNTLDVSGLGIAVAQGETLAFGSASSNLPIQYCAAQISKELTCFAYSNSFLTEQPDWNLLIGVEGVYTNTEKQTQVEQLRQLLQGKYLTVFGDSICTFTGVSNDVTTNSTIGQNAQYYPRGNVTSAEDMFWNQVVHQLDLNLLVNNSWSGSLVLDANPRAAGYNTRPQQLHADTGENAGKNPDIILCNMITNDYMSLKTVGTVDDLTFAWAQQYVAGDAVGEPNTLAKGYAVMVLKMVNAYPDAKIFLVNLLTNSNRTPAMAEPYNKVVNAVAERYGCYVVDVSGSYIGGDNFAAYSLDELHPNKSGMDAWTDLVLDAMAECYLKE